MSPHRVVVLLMNEALPLDATMPMHLLGGVASKFYDLSTATVDGKPVVTSGGGLELVPSGDLQLLRNAQTVIVPGYAPASSTRLDPLTRNALRASAKRGARMVSICTGAFALAQAGILDGMSATTHWASCDELARQHPAVSVDASVLFVDNDTVLTSGGVTAGIDLLLYMLRKDLGGSVGNHVARRIVFVPHREGDQAQFIDTNRAAPDDDVIAAAQQWMLASLTAPITVAQVADQVHMSRRNFHRRFVEKTSLTPLVWLHEQRIARTKELLETTSLSIEEIAAHVGLGSSANLRLHFRRDAHLSPTRYRQLFSQEDSRPTPDRLSATYSD
jgi:transcriptional regulator GlxA family with amidase domain